MSLVQVKVTRVYKTPYDKGYGFGPQITAVFEPVGDMAPQSIYVSEAPTDETILSLEVGEVCTLQAQQSQNNKTFYKIVQTPRGPVKPSQPAPVQQPTTQQPTTQQPPQGENYKALAMAEAQIFLHCIEAVNHSMDGKIFLAEPEKVKIAGFLYQQIKG